MPAHTSVQAAGDLGIRDILSIAIAAFESLEWKTGLAAGSVLTGYTKQSWNRYANQITLEAEDGQFTVTSTMIHGELMDVFNRTQKDVRDFLAAFEECRKNYVAPSAEAGYESLEKLEQDSQEQLKSEITLAMETESVMKTASGSSWITYFLIASNTAIFIFMIVSGVDIMSPAAGDIIQWGGSMSVLTATGEWWRILSSMFVHIGILHLLFNMYGLWYIGKILEPMLGKPVYASAYLFSGVCASLLSVWWHQNDAMVSAGASGAIFGLFGLFLSLLLTDLIPRAVRDSMLRSTAVFVGFNLLYGLKGGVDNSAHIGGLVAGFGSGLLIYQVQLKKREPGSKRQVPLSAALLATAIALSFAVIPAIHVSGGYTSESGADAFNKTIAAFTPLETEALAVYERSNTLSKEAYIRELKTITLENWKKGQDLFIALQKKRLNDRLQNLLKELINYCRLNQEKTELTIRIFSELSQEYNERLNQTETAIEECLERIKSLSGQPAS